jgi:hypothetical protein
MNDDHIVQFFIVTPTLNSATYLNETISSVLQQSGNFFVSYYIHDGGSTDLTLSIISKWKMLVEGGGLPILCRGLNFSFGSESDTGMYDAINRGFSKLPWRKGGFMTWVNSDDILPQGSFATIAKASSDLPDCKFFTGRPALLDQRGMVVTLAEPVAYARDNLIAGSHDGRCLPFVMQEGTFWHTDLWLHIQELDPRFRLAGDWDLWRRLARHAELCAIDGLTGFHRRRPGQLSENIAAYYVEIDTALRAEKGYAPRPEQGGEPEAAITCRFDNAAGRWIQARYCADTPPDVLEEDQINTVCQASTRDGWGLPEGPYPQWGLPGNVRWMNANAGSVTVAASKSGAYRSVLRCRIGEDKVRLKIDYPHDHFERWITERKFKLADLIINEIVRLDRGTNMIALTVDSPAEETSQNLLLFLLINWHFEPLPFWSRWFRSEPLPFWSRWFRRLWFGKNQSGWDFN